VQEADGDRLDLLALELRRDAAHGRLVERQQHRAIGSDALRHAEAQITRHQRLGPLHVDVVLLEAVLPGDLQRIAEPLGGEQGGARALALDQRIGGERRAVNHKRHIGRCALGFGQHGAHARQHGAFGRIGRGQQLDGVGALGRLEHEVGEGAADIDGQSRLHAIRQP
jgi:hypothetical protein